MSSAKKKPAAKGARNKSTATAKKVEIVKPTRVSRQEATQRFLDATIALLEVKPIPDISLQEIAEATSLNHGYVFRYFGTRLDLFTAVTDELARLGAEAGLSELQRRKDAGEDPYALNLNAMSIGRVYTLKRHKVIQYLVSCGVDPTRFGEKSRELISTVENQLVAMGMQPRMARAQAVKISVLIWASDFLLDIFGIDAEESADVQALTLDEIINHKTTTKRLGWK